MRSDFCSLRNEEDFGPLCPPLCPPEYEVICCCGDEYIEFSEKYCGDTALFSDRHRFKFLPESEVYSAIIDHKEKEEKVRKAQERMKSQLGQIRHLLGNGSYGSSFGDLDGGSRRSRRKTKAVSYAEMEADFDDQIENAIKYQQQEPPR